MSSSLLWPLTAAIHSLRWLVFCLAFLPLSCKDSTSPTEPATGYFISLQDGVFSTLDGTATLLGFQVVLDGVDLSLNSTVPAAVSQLPIRVSPLNSAGRHGWHTLVLRVAAQTQSPTSYRASPTTVLLLENCISLHNPCPTVATLQLPEQSMSLATGAGMTYTFAF
jgi:hypothetical protein